MFTRSMEAKILEITGIKVFFYQNMASMAVNVEGIKEGRYDMRPHREDRWKTEKEKRLTTITQNGTQFKGSETNKPWVLLMPSVHCAT